MAFHHLALPLATPSGSGLTARLKIGTCLFAPQNLISHRGSHGGVEADAATHYVAGTPDGKRLRPVFVATSNLAKRFVVVDGE